MNNRINYSRRFFIQTTLFSPKSLFPSHPLFIQLPIKVTAQGVSDFVLVYLNASGSNETHSATATGSGKQPPVLQKHPLR